jgi:hypothetical protein
MGWKNVKNYRFIESSPVPVNGFGTGFLALNYDEASIVYVRADVGAALAPGIQATLEVSFRRGELGKDDTVIPYFSPVVSTASVLASLFSDRLLLKFQARGEASRFVDRAETAKVGSLLLIDLEGTYFLTSQAALVVGIRELGNSAEFWQNYAAETTVFYTGAKWRW